MPISKTRVIALGFILYFFGYLIFTWLLDWEWMPRTTIPDAQLFKKRPEGPLILRDDYISGSKLGHRQNVLRSAKLSMGNGDILGSSIRNIDKDLFDKKLNAPVASFTKLFKSKAKQIYETLRSSKKASRASTGFVLFTLINGAYLNLTLNWLCNVHALNKNKSLLADIHESVLIVALDEKICKRIHSEWPHVICINQFFDSRFNAELTTGQRMHSQLLLHRTHFLVALAEEQIPFLLFEPDSIWLRDPREKLFNAQRIAEDADLVMTVDYNARNGERFTINTMLAFPTDATRRAMQELRRTLTRSITNSDKNVINRLCSMQYMALVCREFELTEVADGKWFKMSESERRSSKIRPFIVNNNIYAGVKNKAARQILALLWFLSPEKNICNIKKTTQLIAKHTLM